MLLPEAALNEPSLAGDLLSRETRPSAIQAQFITQGGEGRGNTSKKSNAMKSKGRGLEEGAKAMRSYGDDPEESATRAFMR